VAGFSGRSKPRTPRLIFVFPAIRQRDAHGILENVILLKDKFNPLLRGAPEEAG
jgi:hypothetical protein